MDGRIWKSSWTTAATHVAADPGGNYLLGVVLGREKKTGIYEVSISDRKCIPLVPGRATFTATFARDGKSFLYTRLLPVVKLRFTVSPGEDGKRHRSTPDRVKGSLCFSSRVR